MSHQSWCLIESDPGVFTELIEKFGVDGIAVEELVALDAAPLSQYNHVYGLIFLHKWKKGHSSSHSSGAVSASGADELYFAKQVVENGCATLALINLLCNFPNLISLGESMENFRSFTQDLDPYLRGTQVAEYEPFRLAHNSFASPYAIDEADPQQEEEGDAHHFVSYIYRNGHIWELDGLKEAPVALAEATEDSALSAMIEVVEQRVREMNADSGKEETSFALMAVVDDPIRQIEEKIRSLRQQEKAVGELEAILTSMKEDREFQHQENIRRRHNYIPAIVELLKGLAEKGVLEQCIAEAQASSK